MEFEAEKQLESTAAIARNVEDAGRAVGRQPCSKKLIESQLVAPPAADWPNNSGRSG